MEIILATNNLHKAVEIKALLNNDFEVLTMKELGIDLEIIEDGKTLTENALIKARALKPWLKDRPALIVADDSGLSVDALDGQPGVYSARYAGEGVSYRDNNEKLLKEMKDLPAEKRGAEFVTVIAILFPDGREMTCEGVVRGQIAKNFRGEGGFGYDPLFIHEETGRSFAQMSEAEKNLLSHRAKAILKLKEILLAENFR